MKKFGLALMLMAMLAVPMLACGFPLPAGNSTQPMLQAVCASGETTDTCEARQTAYAQMASLQSATIPDFSLELVMDDGTTQSVMRMTGSYEYIVTGDPTGLGASIHAVLDEAVISDDTGTQDYSGLEFILIGDQAYSTDDGGATWTVETLGLEGEEALGLGVMLGLNSATGTSLDLFSDPTIFSVSTGAGETYKDQNMLVQTMTVDLAAMLMNPDALNEMMSMGMESGSDFGLDEESLGMDPAEAVMFAAMLMPFLEGTEFSTTLWIGETDGFIHYVEDNYVFVMDSSAMDPTAAPLSIEYTLTGHITNHNATPDIVAPEGATEGSSGLFGGTNLGDSLFGE
ncbi:MAG: hypothetical protein GYB65_10390 [Chloroflexi bacterium]|nr:hypothetical protein [Chloroflexota bacterium]